MSKKRKIILISIISIIILSIIGVIIGLIIGINLNKPYDVSPNDFLEKNENFEFTEVQKTNIYKELDNRFKEDGDVQGFSEKSNEINLYNIYSFTKCNEYLKNDQFNEQLKEKINSFNSLDLSTLTMPNTYYYLYLCKYYGLSPNLTLIKSILLKHYYSTEKLFYINNEKESYSNKLWISYMLYDYLDEDLQNEFKVQEGISNLYASFDLKTPDEGLTLYNSGGDYIYGLYLCSLTNKIFEKESVNSWYLSWKEYYSNLQINSLDEASFYAQFLLISRIFSDTTAINKLESYLSSINKPSFQFNQELILFSSILELININNYQHIKENLISFMNLKINDIFIEIFTFDIVSTYYGIVLSKYVDFNIDEEKIINLYNAVLNEVKNTLNAPQLRVINMIYYYVLSLSILEENKNLLNLLDTSFIITYLDSFFKSIKFNEETLYNEVRAYRQAIEIVSFFKIHQYVFLYKDDSIYISKRNANKLIKEIKKLDIEKFNNIFGIDLLIIDKILKSEIYDVETYNFIIANIKKINSGFAINQNQESDIYSTYLIYSYNRKYGHEFSYLSDTQLFLNSVKTNDGIFAENIVGSITLQSIFYGNQIYNIKLGDKQNVK